jgi:putative transposase
MPQSYTDMLAHIVFSTKGREPTILPAFRSKLYAYMGGIARNHKGTLLAIGGVPDHVHLLVRLHPTLAPAEFIGAVKANSTRWVRDGIDRRFTWQVGYGSFSVSRSNVDAVTRYIAGQERHHRRMRYKTEFLTLLRKHKVEYDERYIWA